MTSTIQTAYDRWSPTYDSQPNLTRDLDAAVLPLIIPPLTGLRVIEAGCGTGKNSAWLAARCHELVALDFSQGMLAQAQQKITAGNIIWTRCDLNRPWPLASETAALVLFNLVLEHIEQLQPLFQQAARVLQPGGQMLLSEYHPDLLLDHLGARITNEQGQIVQLVGSYRHPVQTIQSTAAAAGLTLLETKEWNTENEQRPLLITMRFQNN